MSAQSDNKTITPQDSGKRRGNYQALAWAYLFSPRMVLIGTLLILLLVSGISIIYTTFKNRSLLNELQQLKGERNELQVQWGQLLIEQSTFSLEGRIERKAVDELQMVVPDFSRIVMVDYE